MALLKARFPQVRRHIRPGLTGSLLAEVERGKMDAPIVSRPHLVLAGLVLREAAREPTQLIAAMDEPEADPLTLLRICLGADGPVRVLGLLYHVEQVKAQAMNGIFDALCLVIEGARA